MSKHLQADIESLRDRAAYWKQRAKSAEGHLLTGDWRAACLALHPRTAMAGIPWDELSDAQRNQIRAAAGAVIGEVNSRREKRMPVGANASTDTEDGLAPSEHPDTARLAFVCEHSGDFHYIEQDGVWSVMDARDGLTFIGRHYLSLGEAVDAAKAAVEATT